MMLQLIMVREVKSGDEVSINLCLVLIFLD